VVRQFDSYLDSTKKKYIHLVDGGVADNLGMSVLLERMGGMGGVEGFAEVYGLSPPEHVIVISVNAETEPDPGLSLESVAPGLSATIGLMSGAQIQRANFETLDASQRIVRAIGSTLSREGHPVTSNFVEVSFDLADTDEERAYLKHLPTSFKLSDEQVDHLIAAGRQILRDSPDYQAVLQLLR
jgi:NTE family protein